MRIQKFNDGSFNAELVFRANVPLNSNGTPREPVEALLDFKLEFEAAANAAETLPVGCHDVDDMSAHYVALNGLPSIAGTKWPVTEEIYLHFLEILPPMDLRGNSFLMSEASGHTDTGVVRSKYFKDLRGQYWHEYVEVPFAKDRELEDNHY